MRFIAFLMLVLAGIPAAAQESAEDYPDFPGREATFNFCAACHGFRLVAAQGMTREQWDGALAWMSQRHNMPPLEPADRTAILTYLAQAFPPRTAPGWRNPFAPR